MKNTKPKRVFIIAEAGVNHNGSFKKAKELISAAAEAGADAVKFQTFNTERLVSKLAPKAAYQNMSTSKKESQFNMLKRLELSYNQHKKLMEYCQNRKIMFLSSAFDLESIDLLNRLGMEIFKIPSGEIDNLPYLRRIGRLNKKIILSTGMSNLIEIGKALNILIAAGTKKNNITVLHCNSEYPSSFEDVNLLAMITIKNKFKIDVGYSDHTLGIEIPIAAVSLGATIIEKHFTLDRKLPGPDHKASLEPNELKAMVKSIRNVELALGNGIKVASNSELKNKKIVRKSIVALANIRKGEVLTEENIGIKRPGTGISPMRWDEIIGMRAKLDFNKDELIKL